MHDASACEVLLINPDVQVVNSISLAYIAAFLRREGVSTRIVDFAFHAPSRRALEAAILARPALVGIAAYQRTMPHVIGLARWIKSLADVPIVLGGPQVPAMPDAGLEQLTDIDFLCRGEGELVTWALYRALRGDAAIEDVPGLSRRTHRGVCTTPNPSVPTDLDEYPSPYLTEGVELIASDKALIVTSRGCPFPCKFCQTPFLSNRRIRYHSIERVLAEMTAAARAGWRRLWIADAYFSANKRRCIELFEAIVAARLEVDIWIETRADHIDDDFLRLMARAGVSSVAYGLESANQDVLIQIGKRQRIDRFTEVVRRTQAQGIRAELLHMIGLPGDTFESVLKTFDYIRGMGIRFDGNSTGNPFQLYFGAEYARQPAAAGIVLDERVTDASYPAYLSAGESYQTTALSGSQKALLLARREAEKTVARAARFVADHQSKTGLATSQLLSLPWAHIEAVRGFFELRSAPGAPAECLVVADAASPWHLLEHRLTRVACDALVIALGTSRSPALEAELVERVAAELAAPLPRRLRLACSIDPTELLGHADELAAVARAFSGASRGSFESFGIPSAQELGLMLLLTIDSPERMRIAKSPACAAAVAKLGLAAYPLWIFSDRAAVDRYWALVDAGSFAPDALVIGVSREELVPLLTRRYEARRGQDGLPVLHLVGADTLLVGGRYRPAHDQAVECAKRARGIYARLGPWGLRSVRRRDDIIASWSLDDPRAEAGAW
ncbi:MAG TPA: radical SAM protein [Polyangiaceae bacterium]|nr:radical SAM protein [Polyangiaceae bacterium]